MMKLLLVIFTIGLVVISAQTVRAQDATPGDVHVKLTFADGKSSFRSGEPISLTLEFTADRSGYLVDTMPDGKQPSTDIIAISPDSGISHWLDDFSGNTQIGRHVISSVEIANQPTKVNLILNDSLRFDRPGTYTVSVTTHRVSAKSTANERLALTTNSLSFEVTAMSDADEEREVKRLSALLDAKRDLQTDEHVTKQLSFLTGAPSTREKVRRFVNPEERLGNYGSHIMYGLYIARDRAFALQLLESAMRDPATAVSWSLLGAVAGLRTRRENSGTPRKSQVVYALAPNKGPAVNRIRDAYVTELAATLGKRSGNSQTTTAMTILMALPSDKETAAAITPEVRRILIQQFDSMHEFSREYLLRQQWELLREPALIPSLKKLLTTTGATKNTRDTALERLIELAPEDARPYVVAEIRDANSFVDLAILGRLKEDTLPEVDASLLEQIRTQANSTQSFGRIRLKYKASLAVRYATDGIYQELMEIYRTTSSKMDADSRGAMLAYFAKHNDREAVPLIEKVFGELEADQESNFFPTLTNLYYSEAIGAVVRKRLEIDEPRGASLAAYLISKHGNATDEQLLIARLARWSREWKDRVAEANTNLQGIVERELVLGLISAKAWKLTPERVKELRASCLTEICRQSAGRQ